MVKFYSSQKYLPKNPEKKLAIATAIKDFSKESKDIQRLTRYTAIIEKITAIIPEIKDER